MPLLVLLTMAWCLGLVVAHHLFLPVGVPALPLALVGLLPLLALIARPRDRPLRRSAAATMAFLLGALRLQSSVPDLGDPRLLGHYNDRGWVTVVGVVKGYPAMRRAWTELTIEAEEVEVAGQRLAVTGLALIRTARFPEYRYGDRVRAAGLLRTPPDLADVPYREALARRDIYSVMDHPRMARTDTNQGSPFWAAVYAVKDRARLVIARLIPDPEASLLQGIVLGIESGIPPDLYDDFNATATSHVIVVSGANIVIVSALIAHLFSRLFGRRRATWFTLTGVILYVILVGAEPPVARAGAMSVLYLVARLLGRSSAGYVSLCAAGLLLTILNPWALWDLSFQLSFAATLGILLFAPWLQRSVEQILTRRTSRAPTARLVPYLGDLIAVTCGAQILTMPLIIFTFGRLPLTAPLANLLIVPVQPWIMSWGGAATLVGLVRLLEPLARGVAWVSWLGLTFTIAVVRWLAAWPLSSLQISHSRATWLALGWGGLLLATALARHRPDRLLRLWDRVTSHRAVSACITGLLLVALLICLAFRHLPDGRLHVAFLDVGQGDAILITTPQGQQILVDGGPDSTALTVALGKQMPFWDRSIDLLVATHADADHMTGLTEVIRRYHVKAWWDNGSPRDEPLAIACDGLLERAHVPRRSAVAGDRLTLGQGLSFEVLSPPQGAATGAHSTDNNNSLVVRLCLGQISFLLTGDIEAEAEQRLVRSSQPLTATVLKVAHHGSGSSSTTEFLQAVHPSFSVISVGAANRAGHPAPAVLARLAQLDNVVTLRTDERGTIEFVTDGQRLWIRTER